MKGTTSQDRKNNLARQQEIAEIKKAMREAWCFIKQCEARLNMLASEPPTKQVEQEKVPADQ